MQSVQQVIDYIGRELLRLEKSSARSLIPILADAYRETAHQLLQVLRRNGGERFTAQRYRAAMAQMRAAFEQLEAMGPAVRAELLANGITAGRLAGSHLAFELERFGLRFDGAIAPINFDNTLLLSRGRETLMTRYASSARRYAGSIGQDIRAQLAIGVVKGETIDELTRRLSRLGGAVPGSPVGPRAAVESLFRRHSYWAERLARTEMINAYNHFAVEGIRDLAEDDRKIVMRWDASLDRRVCLICRDLHGRTAKPGKSFTGGYTRAPAHPNCRCTIIAWREGWTELEEGGKSLKQQAAEIDRARAVSTRVDVPW